MSLKLLRDSGHGTLIDRLAKKRRGKCALRVEDSGSNDLQKTKQSMESCNDDILVSQSAT